MNAKRVLLAVFLGLALVLGAVFALAEALALHQATFDGKSADQWRKDLRGGDAAASNRASLCLNGRIIPELTDSALHDTNDSNLKLAVARGLNRLPGVQVYYLTSPGRRGDAMKEVGKFGPAAKASIPVLIQLLKDPDASVRGSAAAALGEIRSNPDLVVPALINCLDDADMNDQAAEALGKFGAQANAAVPKLLPLLHGDKEARHAAALALPDIDPEAAAKAGLKTRKIKLPKPSALAPSPSG